MDATAKSQATAGEGQFSPRYQAYLLAVLACTGFMYQLDRNVIFVTQELIKHEFHLSDTALGLIAGMAYGLANGLLALPLGWLGDRVARKKLLAVVLAIWSGVTALCGLVQNAAQLALARIAVGAAESGGLPSGLSILTDVFPEKTRASRLGIYFAGVSVGNIVSSLAAGAIAGEWGWRAPFLVFGIPGVLLSLLILMTVREPVRTRPADVKPVELPAFVGAAASLVRRPGLRMIYMAYALTSLVTSGVAAWWVSFMMRIHHLSLPQAGVVGSLGLGLCAVLGTVATGFVADRARRRWAGGPLVVVSVMTLVSFAASVTALWTPSTAMMIAALFVAGLTMGAYVGPGNAAVSEMAPPHLRGMAFSIPIVITNIVGLALGPVAVGAISDFAQVHLAHVAPALPIAMQVVLLCQIPVAFIYFQAGRSYTKRAAQSP